MKNTVKQKFDRIDHKLEQLVNDLSHYSHNTLNQPPPDGGWSAMQIMYHMLLAENYAYLYLKKKLSFQPELPDAGIRNYYKTMLLRFYLAAPFKFKAPAGVSDEALPEESDLKEIAKQWKSNRMQLRDFMNTFPESHYRKSIYKHPFAGKLTLDGMLQFFEGHFDRHRKQILRTLKAVSN
jgi:uncharacterized damage-inducible protein DinB